MVETNDREVLSRMVGALAGLTDVTLELMQKQLVFIKAISDLAPEFDAASKRSDFWKNAAKGLEPSDVASFFIVMGRLSELGTQLSKFATLPKADQEKAMQQYKEVATQLNELNSKLQRSG